MRGAARVGDEQSWIARRFLAASWFDLASNAQHCVESRARFAVCSEHMFYPLGTTLSGSIFCYSYSAGIEQRYALSAVVGCRGLPNRNHTLRLSMVSRDSAGGNASDAQPSMDVIIGPESARPIHTAYMGNRVLPLDWPAFAEGAPVRIEEVPSGTLGHATKGTLAAGVRQFEIEWAWDDRPDVEIWLKSLFILGYSEGV